MRRWVGNTHLNLVALPDNELNPPYVNGQGS